MTLREALLNSNHPSIRIIVAREKAREDDARKRANMAHAKHMRDKSIMEIHCLSYSRKAKDGHGGYLVPRKAKDRDRLAAAIQRAHVYAVLSRPDNGYPPPPFRRDPDYPSDAPLRAPKEGLDLNHRIAERNRLVFWLGILESRKAPNEMIQNVQAHVVRLNRAIARGRENDMIRRRPGTKEYSLRPAPNGRRPSFDSIVVEYR